MRKILLSSLIGLLLCGCAATRPSDIGEDNGSRLKLGYCPTMQAEAETLAKQNQGVELVRFGSADEALRGLKNNLIDSALVGRKAKPDEFGEVSEKRLNTTAYTLINSNKRLIDHRELGNLETKTCLDENIALEKFPELNLFFGDCQYVDGGTWLISWDDFTDEMELLIPTDENGRKIAKYRTPFLYGKSEIMEK